MVAQVLDHVTKYAGVVMLGCQLLLCVGNALAQRWNTALYWGGGVLLTLGALRMSGGMP